MQVCLRWLSLLVLLFGSARPEVRAEEPVQSLSIAYDAPSGCPAREALEAAITARVSALPAGARVMVEIRPTNGGLVGSVRLVAGVDARTIAGPDCAALVEGLALIAAMMLAAVETDGAPGSTSAPAPPEAGGSSSLERGRAISGARPRKTPAPAATAQGPFDASSTDPTSPEPASPEPGARPTVPGPPATDGAKDSIRSVEGQRALILSGSSLAVSGVGPVVRPALGLTLGYHVDRAGATAWGFSLHAGARLAWPYTERDAGTSVRYRWAAVATAVCATRTVAARRFGFGACAALEAGALAAQASSRHSRRLWSAAGPGAWVRYSWGRLWLRLGGELLSPLVRDRYFVDETTVMSVPWLVGRAEVSLGARFW